MVARYPARRRPPRRRCRAQARAPAAVRRLHTLQAVQDLPAIATELLDHLKKLRPLVAAAAVQRRPRGAA